MLFFEGLSTQPLSHECAALASAALNAFILKSNRGGDLPAAYTVL
jgi:hypothetical protein